MGRRAIRDKFIAARDWEPPWATKELARTLRDVECSDVASTVIFVDEFSDNHPMEWTN